MPTVEMNRPLDEQFEESKAEEIRRVARRFRSVKNLGGGIRYFALEVARCLEAGLLLSALHVASSLLELYVRKLLVEHWFDKKDPSSDPAQRLNDLEHEVEDRKKLSFKAMVDELESGSVIEASTAEALKTFYSDVRIPIQHGITRRFVREERDWTEKDDIIPLFGLDHRFRFHELEDVVEDKSMKYVKIVSNFVVGR